MISELNNHYPRNGAVYLISGQALLQRQDARGAERYFRKALALVPGNPVIHEALVSSALMLKEYRKAMLLIGQAKKRYPALISRFQVLEGDLLFQEGRSGKAVQLLEKTLESINAKREKDLYLQAAGILALCYDSQGDSAKSIRLYDEVLLLDPGNVLVMNNMAYMLAEQRKELPKARDLAMKAVMAEPLNASYLDTLGWILFGMGEYDKSREYLEKAAGINPREAEIFDHLVQVYDKLGNLRKAEESREILRKLKGK